MATTPAHSDSEPAQERSLDALQHSHAAFLERLSALAGLPALLEQFKLAQDIASSALDLFERELLPHHREEEDHLFPALLRLAETQADRERLEALAAQLTAEHSNLEQLWNVAAPGLRAVAQGRYANMDLALFIRLVRDYSRHAIFEESELLPFARRMVQASPLAASNAHAT